MKLYNSLSKKKELFENADCTVGMYVCGITPYSASHIGHAMFSVVFDVVRRYLEHKGFTVRHIQNFTDIDDKMIASSNERGITVEELAEENISQYLSEMDALNVMRAHEYPRATKEIDSIIKMISVLEEKGHAYAIDGDVYFRVKSDDNYGKLSGRPQEDLLAGARVEIGEIKEDPRDFALWKSEKPGEPSWDSPWGKGRPGWHIECSAMSTRYLGTTLDLHGGGQDLIFPHHENEIAQSESYSGVEPFARFWLHNGLLSLDEDKMSKSIGNVISVKEALESFSPAALRMFFLSSHYRNPLVYSEQNLRAQERALLRLQNSANIVGKKGNSSSPPSGEEYMEKFHAAMDDDLNTPRALAVMFDLSREINKRNDEDDDVTLLVMALLNMTSILGINTQQESFESDRAATPFIDLLVRLRDNLRSEKEFTMADVIRDQLAELDISIEDSPSGTKWKWTR